MPNLNRRGFLAGLGALTGAVGLGAASRTPRYPDRFEHRGNPIWWCNWRQPSNQAVDVGFWLASLTPDHNGRPFVYSTTAGVIDRVAELDVLDLSSRPGWRHMTPRNTDAEREASKQRAAQALVKHLNG